MADPSVFDTALGWVSSIEYLASLPDVDPSILHDLIEAAQDFPDELGKNMREMVSLRCLESLVGRSDRLPQEEAVASAPISQIAFDSSESCEDVLQSIVRQLSVLDLNIAGPELLKWDIQSFIARKRGSMPRCYLEQLKDAFMEGTHPCAASLMERSGLLVSTNNENDDKTTTGDGDSNLVALGVDGCDQAMAPKVITLPLSLENKDRVAGDDLHERNVLPSKRGRSELANENVSENCIEDQVCTDDFGDGHLNSKRCKQGIVIASQSGEHISIALQGKDLMEGSPVRMSSCAEEYVHTEKEPAVGETEVRGSLESDQHGKAHADDVNEALHNECTSASDKLPHDTTLDGQDLVEEADRAEHRLPNCEPSVEIQQKACAGETNIDNGNCNQPNVSNNASLSKVVFANDATSHLSAEEEITSDSGDDDYERVDVGMKKDDFLNSQRDYNSSPALDGTYSNLCVRGCKDGQVLTCSFGGCPLVVHETCLGSSPILNESGEFLCPFCAHSVAIANYLEAKKRVSSTRKKLTKFVQFRFKHQPKEPGKNLCRRRQSRSQKGYVDLHQGHKNFVARECNDANDGESVYEATYNQFLLRKGKEQVVDPPASDMHQPMELSQRLVNNRQGCSHNGDGDLLLANDTDRQFRESGGKEQLVDPPACDMNANFPGHDDPNVIGGVIHSSSREKKKGEEVQQCPSTELERQQDQVCSDPKGKEENVIQGKEIAPVTQGQGEGESEMRALRLKVTSSHEKPVTHHFRRRKIPWTAEEKNILMEGVQKLSNEHDRIMPWKRILEYGDSVFSHNSRTTVDLKDKWRNMCKESLKSK